MRSFQVDIGASLRDSVAQCQRHPVTEFRSTVAMTKYGNAPNTVGARLRMERKEQRVSRAALSRASGIPYSTIAEIENERQKSSTQLHDLANAFPRKLRVEWLATGDGPRYSDSVEDALRRRDTPYFCVTETEMNNLAPEERRDVMTYIKSIKEAVKRSSDDLKPATKSRSNGH